MAGMNDNEDLEFEETDTTQRSERTLRWLRRLTAGVVALTLVIIACTVIPLPYVARLPGPTVDVLGKTQDQQGGLIEILSITGTNPQTGEEITNPDPTAPKEGGQLRMVTVTEMGGPGRRLNVFGWIQAKLTPASEMIPYSKVYPANVTREQVDNRNAHQMENSQYSAQIAALAELGWKVPATVYISGAVEGSDAVGKVQDSDVLESIQTPDGVVHPIETAADPFVIMHSVAPGSTVTITVKRGDDERAETIVTSAPEDGSQGSKMGIYLGVKADIPVEINFAMKDIGGPSAGMMFSLAIIDRLSEGDMTGGQSIAGTGTISYDGTVGPIGGIAQKMQGAKRDGASWFLAPESNCDQVIGHVPEGLRVVRVSTLHEAHEDVVAIGQNRGDSLPTCEAK